MVGVGRNCGGVNCGVGPWHPKSWPGFHRWAPQGRGGGFVYIIGLVLRQPRWFIVLPPIGQQYSIQNKYMDMDGKDCMQVVRLHGLVVRLQRRTSMYISYRKKYKNGHGHGHRQSGKDQMHRHCNRRKRQVGSHAKQEPNIVNTRGVSNKEHGHGHTDAAHSEEPRDTWSHWPVARATEGTYGEAVYTTIPQANAKQQGQKEGFSRGTDGKIRLGDSRTCKGLVGVLHTNLTGKCSPLRALTPKHKR